MKRIITVQDISCVGRCSLTVALPIISAAGVETAVLPTAVLSTHTMFPKYTFHDLTDEITPITDTLRELSIDFDAIYTGYLGSFEQLGLVRRFISEFRREDTLVLVDPAMADNGRLYPGFTPAFAAAMAELCGEADLVIPNLTEASLMLGIPYREEYDEAHIRYILEALCQRGARQAALTGISLSGGIGYYAYDSRQQRFYHYENEKLPVQYHGTGDIFASATLGALMRGRELGEALTVATDFTLASMRATMADPERRFYGVNFEQALPGLIAALS